ncbi:hypothetical protein N9195_00575 [bacterium]|nr:hypothetical protein [bacterium]
MEKISSSLGWRALKGRAICAILLGLLSHAHAALTEEVTDLLIVTPAFILDHHATDGDPATLRNGLETLARVEIDRDNFGDPTVNHEYRVIYRLLDESGFALPLANSDINGDPALAASDPFAVQLGVLDLAASVTVLALYPDPVTTLDNKENYRVEAILQKRFNVLSPWSNVVGSNDTSAPELVHHFTSTDPDDAEYNIRATVSNLAWDRTHALQSDPSIDSFQASITANFARYDDWDEPASLVSTFVEFDFDLFEKSTGTEVALENDGLVERSLKINSHNGASPSVVIFNQSADIKPLTQLRSGSETYVLRCTVRHVEEALAASQDDAECDLSDVGLRHFNGNLSFGAIATTFDALGNVPLHGTTGVNFVNTSIRVPNGEGVLPDAAPYVFGNNTLLQTRLFDNGDAGVFVGSEQVFLPGAPGDPVVHSTNCLTLQYGPVILGTTGLVTNNLIVRLPQGLIYLPDTTVSSHHGRAVITRPGVLPLASDLNIFSDVTITIGANSGIVDESQPLRFSTGALKVLTTGTLDFGAVNSVRYIHQDAFDELETNLNNGIINAVDDRGYDLSDRASNDRYLRRIQGVPGNRVLATAAADKSSRLSAELDIAATAFQTHFPAYAEVNWQSDSTLGLKNGVPENSVLDQTTSVTLSYHQTCPEEIDPCASDVPKEKLEAIPDSDQLHHTPGGGLYTFAQISSPGYLAWGARGDGNSPAAIDPNYPYAHRTDVFSETDFFMPGYQLYAEDNVLVTTAPYSAGGGGDFAPGALLMMGFNKDPFAPELHLPTEPEYLQGDGAYPGLNFTVLNSGETGASRLGGDQSDYSYELLNDGASKYYTRCAGVFGRQVAVEGSFNSSLNIYGYDFELTSFQLSFIASEQEESWINGSVTVTGYSDFSQQFLGLNLTCLGELGDAELDPKDDSVKNLVYWNSTFDALSMRFETFETNPPGSCPVVFDGRFTMGIKTQVAYISEPLYGTFAFNPVDGNLLTKTTGAAIDVDSQLGVPATIPMEGPGADYQLVSVGKLRYSNPTEVPDPPGSFGGFVTFASTINVPYFRDFQVQVMTSANGLPLTPGGDPPTPPLYLAPGWSNGPDTFFNKIYFDPNHTSWPKGQISLAEYQLPDSGTNPDFLIKAEQDLFGIIGLSYPLRWTDTTRHFESMQPEEDEIFVIDVEHQIDYLDAGAASVSFGAKYDGLGDISLTSMLNSQIDGVSEAVSGAVQQPLKNALDDAFAKFEEYLSDSLDAVVNPVVDAAAENVLCPLYDDLKTAYNNSPNWAAFEAQLHAEVEAAVFDVGSPLFATGLRDELIKIADTGQDAASLTAGLRDALEKMITGLDTLVYAVEVDGGTPQFRLIPLTVADSENDIFSGILLENAEGEFPIVESLVKLLIANVVEPDVAAVIGPLLESLASELSAELNAVITEQKDKLERLAEIAREVRGALKEIYEVVDSAAGFIDDFNDMVNEAITAIDGLQEIMSRPATRIVSFIREFAQQNGIDVVGGGSVLNDYINVFDEFDKEAFVDTIKTELKDALMQSRLIQQFHFLVRQTLYDVQAKFEQAVGVMFDQITGIIKEIISENLGAFEDKINPLKGKVQEYMGAAEVKGYAEFNGDSLRKLRLDASMQLKIPDDMQLNVFLEICTYTSTDENACLGPGEEAVEITIGALDVPFDWISEGLKANLSVKMSLLDEGSGLRPHGVGGEFSITDGTIDFQSFKITCLAATIAIGGDECYFGTRACGIFNAYEISIGIFFGRTCTTAPLLLVDEDVGSLFDTDDMPLTGAYVYGEVWLPISELVLGIPASCLFNISAGVGAGVGFFVDDSFSPIFVGKMFLGVSGEALCIVSIKGTVTLTGIVQNGSFSASGTGKLTGKAGWCPFCIKFSASAKVSYKNGDWDVDF